MKPTKQVLPSGYGFDDVAVDLPNFRLEKGGEARALTPRAFDVLVYLIEQRGRVVEKQELFDQIWKETFVTDSALAREIKEIRHALEDDATAPRYIETVPKRGYRFIAKLRESEIPEPLANVFSLPGLANGRRSGENEPGEPGAAGRSVPAKFHARPAVWMSALMLMILLSVVLFTGRGKTIDSLAILPLANGSGAPQMEYLSDGITESLINTLSQLPNLKVLARATVFSYKNRAVDPIKVGRELGVRAVFIGRVVEREGSLIIQADLLDVTDGSQLWGEQYHRKFSDVLAVQEEIAKQISEGLRLKLTGEEQKRLTRHHTENAEAYQLYLKGRYYWNKRTAESLNKGVEYFQQAIDKDPNYALAYAGLTDSYSLLGSSTGGLSPKETFSKAKAAAAKALAIDDTLSEAHAALALVHLRYDWDWSATEREIKRAIALNPNYATTYHWYADYLVVMGRLDEAIAQIKRAQELDPLSLIINTVLGLRLYHARQYDQAIEQCQKTLEMDPNFAQAHFALGEAYEQKAKYEEAIAELQKATTLSPSSPFLFSALGHAYAMSGQAGEAMKILEKLQRLSRQRYVSPHEMAMIYTGLGEKDQAFAWLEKAYADRSWRLPFLNVEPRFDGLRPDPRFADLVRRVGLEP
jgi:TolB-like protein/DNA-binding winged helix-turn-helix (wHTH) protein/Tfp pilus assembly protein PilF